ncbi:hypothetical protein LPJ59_005738, partial [Coemansia sp. RSA 2399]
MCPAKTATVSQRRRRQLRQQKKEKSEASDTCKASADSSSRRAAVLYQPLLGPSHPKYTTTIDDVPAFLRNAYIITGYRRLSYSYGACIRSLGYVHNESGNVLTHLA